MSSHCREALDAQTWRMRSERRHAPRAPIHLQLQVDGVGTAVTRDISANGLYLFIPPRHDTAGPFEIELDLPGCGLRARARCEVVRVERGIWRNGVALRLQDLRIAPSTGRPPRRERWR